MALLIRLLALLPLPVAHLLGWLTGWLFYLIPNPHRHISRTNIELCFPELDTRAQRRLLRHALIETGKTLFETPIIWFCSAARLQRLITRVEGLEWMEQGLRDGKGLLIVAPHLGCWELVSLYCSQQIPFTALYRPLRQRSLEQPVRQGRERFGAQLVPTTPQGIRQLFKALASNGGVGIPPDQDPRHNGGIFAPFFGTAANTMTLLPRLIQRSGATPLLTVAERLPWGQGFTLRFNPIENIDGQPTQSEIATAINRASEHAIRRTPSQYQWSYRRFRTRPAGESPLYQ